MQGTTAAEWKECHAAALLIGKRGSEMADQMQHSACMLVMEFVPGSALFNVQKPFEADNLEQTAADLGRSEPPFSLATNHDCCLLLQPWKMILTTSSPACRLLHAVFFCFMAHCNMAHFPLSPPSS